MCVRERLSVMHQQVEVWKRTPPPRLEHLMEDLFGYDTDKNTTPTPTPTPTPRKLKVGQNLGLWSVWRLTAVSPKDTVSFHFVVRLSV